MCQPVTKVRTVTVTVTIQAEGEQPQSKTKTYQWLESYPSSEALNDAFEAIELYEPD